MPRPLIKRRSLLVGTVAIAGGAAAWQFQSWQDQRHPLANSSAARRLGARFAGKYSDDPLAFWRGPPPGESDWGVRLEELRQQDFDADRLVEVDGWWLAETEIRFCVFLHESG